MDKPSLPESYVRATPLFRASFCYVMKPRSYSGDLENAKYEVTMLFKPGEDLSELNRAATYALLQAWPNYNKARDKKQLPFKLQMEKSDKYDGYSPEVDAVYVKATATQRFKPKVIDARGEIIIDETKIYSGIWAKATLRAYAYEKGKSGVSFNLVNFMKVKDDTPLGRTTVEMDAYTDEEIEALDAETKNIDMVPF